MDRLSRTFLIIYRPTELGGVLYTVLQSYLQVETGPTELQCGHCRAPSYLRYTRATGVAMFRPHKPDGYAEE